MNIVGSNSLDRRVRNILIATTVAIVVFGAALGAFLFWYLGGEEEAVKTSTSQFVTALVEKDPGSAPEGGADYVRGIPLAFGPVRSAEALERRKKSVGSGSQARSYWVSEVLLRTERGAAVIELAYDDNSIKPSDAKITQVYELEPGRIESSLSAGVRADVKRGYKTRGSKAIGSTVLDGTFTVDGEFETRDDPQAVDPTEPPVDVEPTPAPPAPSPAEVEKEQKRIERERRKAEKRIKCVQDANGDVNKLQKCAEI